MYRASCRPRICAARCSNFSAQFEPRANPRSAGRSEFTPEQRRGAELFEHHCESCHAARFASDDPATRAPPERWQSLLFDGKGSLIWARGDYEFTGVLPYVGPRGTRIAALRRTVDKFPYFTNGSAHSLSQVVARSGWVDGRFSHAGASALSVAEQGALVEFLQLL
ncbi:MAG: hypothetical protein QM756_29130 [Polyangiaceae bacterium]